jgi:hypothetical protein
MRKTLGARALSGAVAVMAVGGLCAGLLPLSCGDCPVGDPDCCAGVCMKFQRGDHAAARSIALVWVGKREDMPDCEALGMEPEVAYPPPKFATLKEGATCPPCRCETRGCKESGRFVMKKGSTCVDPTPPPWAGVVRGTTRGSTCLSGSERFDGSTPVAGEPMAAWVDGQDQDRSYDGCFPVQPPEDELEPLWGDVAVSCAWPREWGMDCRLDEAYCEPHLPDGFQYCSRLSNVEEDVPCSDPYSEKVTLYGRIAGCEEGCGCDAITTPACEYSAALYEDVECTQLILEASLGNILETIACVDKPLDKPLGCLCAGVVTKSLAVCAPPRDPVPDERKPVPSDQHVYCCMPRGA